MKYVFTNLKTGEKLIRENPENMCLEENWTGNTIDSWAMMIVRGRWLDEGKLNRFVDFSELMYMNDEKKREFCDEVKKEKKNLKFEILEETFPDEENQFQIDPSSANAPIEDLYIEPPVENSDKLKKR